MDYDDGTVSTSMQMPVKNRDGRFLGIGGVDILITTVGEIVSQITYKNQGHAFLVSKAGDIVYLPEDQQDTWFMKNLTAVDSLFSHAKGFDHLTTQIQDLDE